jgi:hypothetical protein
MLFFDVTVVCIQQIFFFVSDFDDCTVYCVLVRSYINSSNNLKFHSSLRGILLMK